MSNKYQILVLGDASVDRHIIKDNESDTKPLTWQNPGGYIVENQGGSWLLCNLFNNLLNCDVISKDYYQEENPNYPELSKLTNISETLTICSPFPQDSKSKEAVFRIDNLCVFRPIQIPSPIKGKFKKDIYPHVVVIDDSGHGIRKQESEVVELLSSISDKSDIEIPWIILKVAYPILENSLLIELSKKWGSKLIVIAPINDLRQNKLQISRGLSWERTAQDLSWEFHYNPRMQMFSNIHSLIVPVGLSGVWFSECELSGKNGTIASRTKLRLVFDPSCIEGDWEKERPGLLLGYTSCLTLSVVNELINKAQPDLKLASQGGLSVMRALHVNGYKIDKENGKIALPIEQMREALEDVKDFPDVIVPLGYRHYSVPTRGNTKFPFPPQWSILKESVGSSSKLFDLGRKIVKYGTIKSLAGKVPFTRIGDLITVDRNEIEGFRMIYDLMMDYCRNQALHKPLSFAVFGPPGSGKSFGIAQVARAVAGDKIKEITFNVTQFINYEDLINAFHMVRDIGLSGKIPFVFWDEFDSDNLNWLKAFLSPMQDGEFTQGQIKHPIGRAIFIFAGGIAKTLDDIGSGLLIDERKMAKIPDFISRLRGCINIMGINRVNRNHKEINDCDPEHVIRRAIVLRSILERKRKDIIDCEGVAEIDDGLLKTFLSVWAYKHGNRSLESIVELCHIDNLRSLNRSSIPPQEVLSLHVESIEFMGLITADVEFQGDVIDILANKYHETYRELSPDSPLAKFSFNDLLEEDKDKNRDAVKGLPHKLATIGYKFEKISVASTHTIKEISEEDAELLARMEHDRWIITKIDDGFIHGEKRNDSSFPKTHPDLVFWDKKNPKDPKDLPEEQYPEYIKSRLGPGPLNNPIDIELAKRIPEIMSVAGYRVIKL